MDMIFTKNSVLNFTFAAMPIRLKLLFYLFPAVVVVSSCNDSFEPNLASSPTPVVYGVICPQDSIYSVRLTKTFIGAGDALDYAGMADSIYYAGARVFLETRSPSGQLVGWTEMVERTIEDRVPGIFATRPNRIFQADSSQIRLRPEDFTGTGQSYNVNLCLKVVVPGRRDTISAATRLRSVPKLTEPRFTFVKVYFYTEEPFMMEWLDTNEESYFQILVRMHYTDFLYDEEREMTAEWVLSGIETNMTGYPGGEHKFYSYYFRPENFYAKVRSVIRADPEVEARVCRKVDFIVLSSNREMEYYRDVYEIADDYHGTGYTNITNGLGIFTTFSSTGIYGLELGQTEQDSLAAGRYTRHLKFRSY
jgi:hypothetical protein